MSIFYQIKQVNGSLFIHRPARSLPTNYSVFLFAVFG